MGRRYQRIHRWSEKQSAVLSDRRCRLGQNPRDSAPCLNRLSVGAVLDVGGATPVTRCRAACVLDSAAHRACHRDGHADIAGSNRARRLARRLPYRRAHCDRDDDDCARYPYGAALARRQRVGRWGLTCVDRQRLVRPARSLEAIATASPGSGWPRAAAARSAATRTRDRVAPRSTAS
jgi:hypothetical protein